MTWLMVALGVVVGAAAGAAIYAAWMRHTADPKLRMPEKWPLRARGLVTTEELEVFKWLRKTFDDYDVMVKIPVTRFTIPNDRDKSEQEIEKWLEVLNGVYTTFSVCTFDGKVMGCVDVPGKRGLSKGNRELKESLLSDCGIGYTVVRGTHLPKSNAMRAAFLGELLMDEEDHQDTRGGDSSFHADLDAFTKEKVKAAKEAALKELNRNADETSRPKQAAGFNADGTAAKTGSSRPDRFAVPWVDSFTQPSDHRPARLE